jgi:hypothetical protein
MKTTSICRRCHRLKSVDLTSYCIGCRTELRNAEKRRPTRVEPETIDLSKTDPPPPPAPASPRKSALTFIEPNFDDSREV